MKTTTFKNTWIPSNNKLIVVGTNKKNQRWSFPTESHKASMQIAKAIMKKGGKVNLNGWEPYTV